VCQRRLHMFWLPRKSIWPGSSGKWGVVLEYSVNCRLLLAVKSLYSCSEICVRNGWVKTQSFIVDVGIPPKVCAVIITFHILYELERQSQLNRRCGHCWKLYDQPFVLCRRFGAASLLWTESYNMQLITFLLRATMWDWKLVLKTQCYISPEIQDKAHCKSGNIIQQVKKFKQLGVLFTSDARQNKESDKWNGKANAFLLELYRSVVTKQSF